jgi:site-specific recombinase XerD
VKDAGISKKVTFHVARHTFATMTLTTGSDIYTTSQLLGHSDVAVTQIYGKIIDKKKIAATYLIDKLFEED